MMEEKANCGHRGTSSECAFTN